MLQQAKTAADAMGLPGDNPELPTMLWMLRALAFRVQGGPVYGAALGSLWPNAWRQNWLTIPSGVRTNLHH